MMEINVVEDKKNKLVFELKGEGHVFCNALTKELWNDKKVKVASYRIAHPLVSVPNVIVETTKDGNPKTAVKGAVKRLAKDADKFNQVFKKGVK